MQDGTTIKTWGVGPHLVSVRLHDSAKRAERRYRVWIDCECRSTGYPRKQWAMNCARMHVERLRREVG